jgi:acyl-CoA thioesterase-1
VGEIVRHLVELRRPGAGIRVINHGLSAHTTAMVLHRWPAAMASRPDWILCALGATTPPASVPNPPSHR